MIDTARRGLAPGLFRTAHVFGWPANRNLPADRFSARSTTSTRARAFEDAIHVSVSNGLLQEVLGAAAGQASGSAEGSNTEVHEAGGPKAVGSSSQKLRLAVLLIAGLGMAMVAAATWLGVGTSPDSAAYVGTARNLLAGRGLTLPFGAAIEASLLRFPPLYPAMLAASGFLGGDPLASARWLNTLLLGANVLLIAGATWSLSRGAAWATLAAAFLMAFSPILVELHSMAWSEPLFIFLGAAGLAGLEIHLRTRARGSLLVSAMAIALVCLTRYAGLALVLTAAAGLLLFGRMAWKVRLAEATGLVSLASLPLGLWLTHSRLQAGTIAGRSIVFHPPLVSAYVGLVDSLSGWLLLPATLTTRIRLGLLVLAGIGLLIAALFPTRPSGLPTMRGLLRQAKAALSGVRTPVLFVLIYMAFLLVSISLVDANTAFDSRILSPVYVAGLTTVFGLLGSKTAGKGGLRLPSLWIGILILILCGGLLVRSAAWADRARHTGIGFNQRIWKDSPTLNYLRTLPLGLPLYSNAPEAIYLNLGRSAVALPRAFRLSEQSNNPDFTVEVLALQHRVRTESAVIAYFTRVGSQSLSPQALENMLGVGRLLEASDGIVFGERP